MKNVSNFALEDNRLKIIIGDAVKYIMNTKETYDLIVEDMYLEITTIKQKTDYNLLKNCITKTKVLSSKDDIKKFQDQIYIELLIKIYLQKILYFKK